MRNTARQFYIPRSPADFAAVLFLRRFGPSASPMQRLNQIVAGCMMTTKCIEKPKRLANVATAYA